MGLVHLICTATCTCAHVAPLLIGWEPLLCGSQATHPCAEGIGYSRPTQIEDAPLASLGLQSGKGSHLSSHCQSLLSQLRGAGGQQQMLPLQQGQIPKILLPFASQRVIDTTCDNGE